MSHLGQGRLLACPLKSIRLNNILSFGPDGLQLDLKPLNVLIGPNASGKSNLIEVLALLRATPSDISDVIREGGGVREWIWKGRQRADEALIEVVMDYSQAGRELRVIVEADKVTDQDSEKLSFDIAQKIQTEMTFPGQIKVTVIREKRAVNVAR